MALLVPEMVIGPLQRLGQLSDLEVGLHTGQDLGAVERLRQEIVAADLEAFDLFVDFRLDRDEDDRNIFVLTLSPEPPANLVSVNAR